MPSPTTLNIVGLLLNLAGVILLFRFGIPYYVRTGGAMHLVLQGTDEESARAESVASRIGWTGLGLVVLATIAQIIVFIIIRAPPRAASISRRITRFM